MRHLNQGISDRPESRFKSRLRITLLDLDPAPWRKIEVPLSMTFKGLHDTIQAAFLWFDSHLWEFDFAGRTYGLPSMMVLAATESTRPAPRA